MDYRWLLRSAVLAPIGALALTAMSPGCGDDEPATFECVGEQCEFDCPEGDASCQATCKQGADCDLNCEGEDCALDCQSKSTCDADCTVSGGCDADCEGQSTCNVDCSQSEGCDLDCAGGSICTTTCSGDCGGGCQGTSECNLNCDQSCSLGCTGSAICNVACKTGCMICCDGSAECSLSCSEAETTECMIDENTFILVCGRECPTSDAECDYGDETAEPEPEPK